MVLVTAEAIEPHLLGILHLVKEFVVELMPLFGVEEMARYIHPHAAIFLRKILWQEAIRHQMKPVEVHHQTSCMSALSWVSGDAQHHLRCPAAHMLSRGKPDAAHRLHVGLGFTPLDGGYQVLMRFQ